jgi:hypothetical protein
MRALREMLCQIASCYAAVAITAGRMLRVKILVLTLAVFLSGCGWFHGAKPSAPKTPEIIVTGVPAGALLLVDGVQSGGAQEPDNRTRVISVAPGTHLLEVKMGDSVVYRESADLASGDKRVITVLSGGSRD